MINHTELSENPSVDELAVIVFNISRKYCGDHDEKQINNNTHLRGNLVKKIMAECKELMPEISGEQWSLAIKRIL